MGGLMISVYIHIPFCESICSYCDFCKFLYNSKWVDNYLIALKNEILLRYRGEIVKTLYIGGGTPSCLSINELKKLVRNEIWAIDALWRQPQQASLAVD